MIAGPIDEPVGRIAVLGSGANGSGIGADLVIAGHDVTFIEQWPAHVEAIREKGLRIEMPEETVITPVTVHHLCEVAELREPFDIVFVVVKAYDTRWACELIRPLLTENSLVVGVQNGMSIDDIVDVVGAPRAVGAVIEISANMFDPGVVERQSPPERSWFAVGTLPGGPESQLEHVAKVLRSAGTVEISDDIRASKWMKLVVNAAELVPSAILNLPLSEATQTPGMRDFMIETGREAMDAAILSGVQPRSIFGMPFDASENPHVFVERLFDAVIDGYTLPSTQTTVLQDWRKGRRSEVDQINGLVLHEHHRAGRRAPRNERVVDLAHRIEAGDLEASPANIDMLLA
jgi:2-dehydropantoate 2-reductase